jgi:membrane protease YdiL (CAAX protease family)
MTVPPRFADESRARLGFAFAVVVALMMNILVILTIVPRTVLQMAPGELFAGGPASFGVLALAFCYAVFGVTLGLLVGFGRVSLLSLGWRFDNLARDVLVGVVGAAVCIGFFVLLVSLVFDADPVDIVNEWGAFTLPQRLMMFLIGVMAAFSEESVFRGHLQPLLARRMPVVVAIVLQAVVFAVYHLVLNHVGLVTKAFFGVVYGVQYWRTGSLVAPAVTHFLIWNIVGFA